MPAYPVEEWITDQQAEKTDYADFWNDAGKMDMNAITKAIIDKNFDRFETLLRQDALAEDLAECLDFVKNALGRTLTGRGIDLAAGNCWPVKQLFDAGSIEKLYALDYSRPVLFNVGRSLLEHYGLPEDKIVLVRGSFYALRIPDNSLDFVFLSAAFHHAEHPEKLLAEMRRVLKAGGLAILIGEHVFDYSKSCAAHIVKYFAQFAPANVQQRLFGKTFRIKRLFPTREDLDPPDPVMGDHLYTGREYGTMFSKAGFVIEKNFRNKKAPFQSFVLSLKK